MTQDHLASWAPSLFAGKAVLVTGATSGIGLAIAQAFKALGASVTGTATTREKADALAAQGIEAAVVNVTDDEGVRHLVEDLPRLDVLVNNAGAVRRAAEHNFDTFREVVDINLFGTARFALWSRPKLAESKGSVINIASMLSTFGDPFVPAYSASKGAVTQLTKSLAIAYAAEGIRVNAIAPGWIATPLTEPLQRDAMRNPAIVTRTPMGRWGSPEEIAEGAVYLASPAARFVTGATLTIDGGYSIR